MATIALPRPVPPHRASSSITTLGSSALPIDSVNVPPVPNKHIPVCPPGPVPETQDESVTTLKYSGVVDSHSSAPVPTVITTSATVASPDSAESAPNSLLYPPDKFTRLQSVDGGTLVVYELNPVSVAAAIEHIAGQSLPDPSLVFPWYHGLHPGNHIQQAFFVQRRRTLRRTPCCLRGVTVVKADGDLSISRLKGAIAPHELLQPGDKPEFLEVDPREGFSVRNFQIQAAKAAMTSDIVIYGTGGDEALVRRLGWDMAHAQRLWRQKHEVMGHTLPEYNTFVCTGPFSEFEQRHPELVAVDSAGGLTGNVVDLFLQERREMYSMTKASMISHNVWMGPTPEHGSEDERKYDVLIECSDVGHLNPAGLRTLVGRPDQMVEQAFFEFPSSGSILPPTWSQAEADGILDTCKWIYHLAHGIAPLATHRQGQQVGSGENLEKGRNRSQTEEEDRNVSVNISADDDVIGDDEEEYDDGDDDDDDGSARDKDEDGDTAMADEYPTSSSSTCSSSTSSATCGLVKAANAPERRILIHCADGYTESTMLGIAYYSYSTGMPVPEAWLNLHTARKRNFFAYPTDVGLLTAIAPRLLSASPACVGKSLGEITALLKNEPRWLPGLDGSFPSRVLDYMYLGNLGHANNPDLLRALGIGQILSVGETAMWRDGELDEWGPENVCTVQGVQDNGIDPLTSEFERCLEFIDHGRRNGTATLVHCRVGVSRSATICIAEVMRAMNLSFPRAYCFVRARRLNVIIQPHLRFAYELLKWEETLQVRQSAGSKTHKATGFKRELEWGEIAREVALMNRPYAR